MMTCRLLCALLVLALCCCPSVCVTTTEGKAGKAGKDSGSTNSNPEGQDHLTESPGKTPSPPKNNEEGRGTEDSQKMETLASHTTATVTETPRPPNTSHNTQDQDDGKPTTEDAGIDKSNMSNEQNEKENAPTATTTTTTTKAPSTTTTTTTTTNAPEAPTTTTTRAPSLLREIDGSLSSSAWVCAPLLLAVSALAYTTVG
ncbi:putative mucin TcMUCII [Trypanosoma cruzi]|uniref:Mucin TcMUCII, putative n=2 Tax=Trypanosoma cruzi TaxID=5693 RepID=Q4DXZ3_TRYCC|nr:mucin TcMUCII, putative [Trypanosoma cruzi]EAN97407.1 mucin TcMUCII, putative [Trypanosoma cruzi]PWV19968.1 putative mucin TcMUCII [Trypanosoma cruzi]RNC52237.1 mucin TcMUCII [Trypanosoma cruzi]|eukprot:XP_819258.1 mucin TcMUCII [Trypanosoma cruzi strain CL Brener]